MSDEVDVKSIIANLTYDQFDPDNLSVNQYDLQHELIRLLDAGELSKSDWVTIAGFDCFAMLMELGWERVCYESHLIDGGYMYWMSNEHGKAIGESLRPSLKELRIDLTILQDDGFSAMANSISPGIQTSELFINHRSGDEVGINEVKGLARLIEKLQVKKFHLWAPEYEDGVLDIFLSELKSLKNKSLNCVDICDTSKSEPEDQIVHIELNSWLEKR